MSNNPSADTVWQLWGKADEALAKEAAKQGRLLPEWHPLLCHMLDVTSVAHAMLSGRLPRATMRRLIEPLGLDHEDAIAWLSFLVALHDLGKITPAFQAKWPKGKEVLACLGFTFNPPSNAAYHGVMTVAAEESERLLSNILSGDTKLARAFMRAVGAHHGDFPSDVVVDNACNTHELGKEPWISARREVFNLLVHHFELSKRGVPSAAALSHDYGFFMLLAGLTSVADWIGSMAEVFVYTSPPGSLAAYAPLAAQRAEEALHHIGFSKLPPSTPMPSFEALFSTPGKKMVAWPLHTAVADVAKGLTEPSLVVIEAPMGEGKTEAALYLAEALRRSGGNEGLFIGLPTQATSNQMYRRVKAFLERAHEDEHVNLHLSHGEAALVDDYNRSQLPIHAVYGAKASARDNNVVAEEWFARGKRALLSPYAVGTIDQALLGVLHVRHGFVRLFGAGGKVVVLDEVHAYDTYTSALMTLLVTWLKSMGASVILLSATLPKARRAALIRAFVEEEPPAKPYPRITWASGGFTGSLHVAQRRPPISVTIERAGPAIQDTAQRLTSLIEHGGRAAWIVNTVDRSQEVYQHLVGLRREGVLDGSTKIDLIHARFPFEDRRKREVMAEENYGRDGKRPARAILVGTQVLEQSLDLDFDVMVSDYAPIDLLLQRSGRLHRHERQGRPERVASPRFLVVDPDSAERVGGPSFEKASGVYEKYVMLRSWLTLKDRRAWALPLDLEPFIEEVYGDGPFPEGLAPELVQRLERERQELQQKQEQHEDSAAQRTIPEPHGEDDIFGAGAVELAEEDDGVHQSLRALTRLGDPSIDVVCLYGTRDRAFLDPAGREPARLSEKPSANEAKRLLLRSVGISKRGLYQALSALDVPDGWKASAFLRRHRPLLLNAEGAATCAGFELRLDEERGLVIQRGQPKTYP